MSKLKKTMKSRVSQFDDMYAKGLEELEQVEQSAGEKRLYVLGVIELNAGADIDHRYRQKMFEVFKAFLEDAARKPEEEPEDLTDILESLEVRNLVAHSD